MAQLWSCAESTPTEKSSRILAVMGWGAFAAACGGFEFPPPPESPDVRSSPALVRADPPGHEFSGSTIVRLRPMESAPVEIYYTTDGSVPTGEHAEVYTGALELEATTLLNFIARDTATGAWSMPGSELYTAKREEAVAQDVARGLYQDPQMVFFVWQPGAAVPMRETVRLVSGGREPVTIRSIRLVRNPAGQFFWVDGAFELTVPDDRRVLAPGEALEVDLSYMPTSTFRSAAIEVLSDSERSEGRTLIEVWGRTSAW